VSDPLFLKIKVHADAKANRLVVKGMDRFEVWVREPAEAGRANKAVLDLVSAHLKVPVGRLWLIKGAQSPSKIISVKSPIPGGAA